VNAARTALMRLLNQAEPGYLAHHFGDAYEIDTIADTLLVVHRAQVRPEVLNEAAAKLMAIADETEAKVAEHYGASSGIGPGSAEMVREAARTVLSMATAGQAASGSQPDTGDTTQTTEQPDPRRDRYAAALREADTYAQLGNRRDLKRFVTAAIAMADTELDPVYRSGYGTGRMHAGAGGFVLDTFEAVISTSDGSYGAAEEYRCRTCGAIGAQGEGPKSLLDLMAMAARHECLPRVEGGEAQ
jgi:hypothetical protein